jgi:hypothetical protein
VGANVGLLDFLKFFGSLGVGCWGLSLFWGIDQLWWKSDGFGIVNVGFRR